MVTIDKVAATIYQSIGMTTNEFAKQLAFAYAKEAIKEDRENTLKHIVLNIDGRAGDKEYIVEKGNNYLEIEIRIDKNSLLNAPQIELL